MYCLAASAQIVFMGSLFWMCHHSIVTGLPEPEAEFLVAEESLLSSPPPQATSSAPAMIAASAKRTDFTIFLSSFIGCRGCFVAPRASSRVRRDGPRLARGRGEPLWPPSR